MRPTHPTPSLAQAELRPAAGSHTTQRRYGCRQLRVLISLLLLMAVASGGYAQPAVPTTPASAGPFNDGFLRNPRLGLAHISAPEGGTSAERYRTALSLGAGWNRFPIYWDRIEGAPNTFNWGAYDRQIADDLLYDLQINAILLGRPFFYQDGDRITGLNAPVFADGTDIPGPDKQINPDNVWARFVYEAINRYKPDGAASAAGTLPPGEGIRVWEIWNEPDVPMFWSASIGDYARLLKVAYLSGKMADPEAKIMFAGLLFGTSDNWLARVLALFENDAQRETYNWYMDAVAIHAYSDPWRTGWLVLNVKQTLIAYGIDKEIWVTENGVPVWDDYPGPTWEADPAKRLRRATQLQQAWYIVQSAVYAWLEGADVLIFHQLYDDCGDQPPGTNFPPHNGNLCTEGQLCSGDAHGLFRNMSTSVCFSQHPQPGTPRPAANAYSLLAQVFNVPFSPAQMDALTAEQVSTQKPNGVFTSAFTTDDGRRISVLWNRTTDATTVALNATGDGAQMIMLDGDDLIAPDENGQYRIVLPPAVADGYPDLQPGADSAIGGPPVILIEQVGGVLTPLALRRNLLATGRVAALPSVLPTPTMATVVIAPRPTVDPARDTQAPLAFVNPLPLTSPATFNVSWRGQDDSGIESYLVWVRVDKGEWQPWMETAETSASYSGVAGSLYEFDIWAQDLAGNWTTRVELAPQAVTRVE